MVLSLLALVYRPQVRWPALRSYSIPLARLYLSSPLNAPYITNNNRNIKGKAVAIEAV
jgi:hypothetical protein